MAGAGQPAGVARGGWAALTWPGTEVIRIRPGELSDPPAGINPLEPAIGPNGIRFPLQTHADLVRALFLAAFEADEPFPQVLAAALNRCYENAGWDLVTGEPASRQYCSSGRSSRSCGLPERRVQGHAARL
jgi:hypothetical protein